MDHDQRRRGAAEKRSSLLQGRDHESLFHKTLSRNSSVSSVGCSSRFYYYRNAEGVPFNWEMQPGTTKYPPKEEVIPPLSPPPAVLSSELPKPCFEQPKAQAAVSWPRLIRFWNKSKQTNKQRKNNVNAAGFTTGSDKFDQKFEFFSSDSCEFMGSARNSSSSSSSSLSFSNGPSMRSSGLRSPGRDSFHGTYGCSPWNISAIVLSIARRG